MNKGDSPGAIHCDDLFYIFKTDYAKVPSNDSTEFGLMKKMIELLTSFAETGCPTTSSWDPVADIDKPLKCFNITNEDMKMTSMPENERMAIWDHVYNEASVDLI